ncbi:hypothetical protein FLA105534_00738 [Flavobacterium bizetiae]|uniref:Uncharacterized protein n=1 Tax=Flavobacterium bizetiae TaxID=2704140 RepID=A0A6J4G955_9FLAO|nr:hypothetical protein [Flavobacterium bizetiae]CAA9195618.1 hypothetical protein FLA105534_00738 [Flavobacterium bizetiae]CAD5340632.1 hypothetical protein FLA105535_00587 [Flavobacterium bizetiae]CAD5346696.1 hypothetical protein FLA105534_00639 [Flavobacterium bizetiae]
MRKVIIYIFIFLIVSNIGFFQQFYKLPILIEHYKEHQQRHNVSFIDFLEMHYWGEDLNDNDSDRDMQLPFKHISSASFQLVFVPSEKHTFDIFFNTDFSESRIIPFTSNLYSDPALFSVFRPPLA